jgi:AraC-like DNA-binding protein
MHSYYELHYVTGGTGTLNIDALSFPLSAGTLYLLPPKTNHEQLTNQNDFLNEYHLAFEVIDHDESDIIWTHLLTATIIRSDLTTLEPYFDRIANESLHKQYGYLDVIKQNLESIFITLVRILTPENRIVPESNSTLDDKRIMMIDDAFLFQHETITLSNLSNQLKLSTRQTQRFIEEKYGTSFTELKQKAKLNQASKLITTTSQTLNEISLSLGFKSYSYFNKAFMKHFNCSPSEYRRRINECIK